MRKEAQALRMKIKRTEKLHGREAEIGKSGWGSSKGEGMRKREERSSQRETQRDRERARNTSDPAILGQHLHHLQTVGLVLSLLFCMSCRVVEAARPSKGNSSGGRTHVFSNRKEKKESDINIKHSLIYPFTQAHAHRQKTKKKKKERRMKVITRTNYPKQERQRQLLGYT